MQYSNPSEALADNHRPCSLVVLLPEQLWMLLNDALHISYWQIMCITPQCWHHLSECKHRSSMMLVCMAIDGNSVHQHLQTRNQNTVNRESAKTEVVVPFNQSGHAALTTNQSNIQTQIVNLQRITQNANAWCRCTNLCAHNACKDQSPNALFKNLQQTPRTHTTSRPSKLHSTAVQLIQILYSLLRLSCHAWLQSHVCGTLKHKDALSVI